MPSSPSAAAGAPAPQPPARSRRSEMEKAQGLARIHRTGYSFEGLDDDRTWRSTPWHKPDSESRYPSWAKACVLCACALPCSLASVVNVDTRLRHLRHLPLLVSLAVLRARDYYKSLLFQQGEASLLSTTIRDLNSLGVGISLHFRLLKYLVRARDGAAARSRAFSTAGVRRCSSSFSLPRPSLSSLRF